MSKRYLTKSRFKLAVECRTKLYYAGKEGEYKNNMQDDTFLQMLADGGYQVGALAKLMYPTGHEITSKNHDEAEAETVELLKQDEVILFEPAIRFGDTTLHYNFQNHSCMTHKQSLKGRWSCLLIFPFFQSGD